MSKQIYNITRSWKCQQLRYVACLVHVLASSAHQPDDGVTEMPSSNIIFTESHMRYTCASPFMSRLGSVASRFLQMRFSNPAMQILVHLP